MKKFGFIFLFLLIVLFPMRAVLGAGIDCSIVDGLSVFGYDKNDIYKFIGSITSEYDSYSIANEYGAGSEYKSDSIFNDYGDYGSEFKNTSARNTTASKPPILVDKNLNIIGYITYNNDLPGILPEVARACAEKSYKHSIKDHEKLKIRFNITVKNIYNKICPDMVNGYLGNDGNCYCNNGYAWDSTSNRCVITKTKDDICKERYGSDVYYNSSNDSCDCTGGKVLIDKKCRYGVLGSVAGVEYAEYDNFGALIVGIIDEKLEGNVLIVNKECTPIYNYKDNYSKVIFIETNSLYDFDYNNKSIYLIDDKVTCYIYASKSTAEYNKEKNSSAKTCPNNSHLGSDNKCYCDVGYIIKDNKCITYTEACKLQYGNNVYGDEKYCYCNTGYEWNSDKTNCIKKVNTTTTTTTCGAGYILKNNKCISYTEACQLNYGEGSYSDGDYCRCKAGYKMNSDKTKCVIENKQLENAINKGKTKIPNPDEIKNYKDIEKIGNDLYGIKITKTTETTIAKTTTITTTKKTKIPHPDEIKNYKDIEQIGDSLYGIKIK